MYNKSGGENMKKFREFSFIKDESSGDTCYFSLKGQVFTNEALYMENALEDALRYGYTDIIINMTLVDSFSSSAIRAVLLINKKLKSRGGRLQISNPSENVRNVIGMTALDEMLLK